MFLTPREMDKLQIFTAAQLAQRRKELEKARTKLKETNYYSFWNKKYLKEILNA